MKRVFLTLCSVLLLTVGTVHAQSQAKSKFQFSAGPGVSLPVGDLSEFYTVGLGLELSGSYQLSKSVEAFGQVGFHNFFGKNVDLGFGSVNVGSAQHFPFLFGARYRGSKVIAGLGLGYGIWESDGGFTYSPQLGVDLGKFDLLAHYTSTTEEGSNLSYIGLKLFYKF